MKVIARRSLVTAPFAVGGGVFFALTLLNGGGAVAESLETNNTRATSITVS
jgi:hypothetical protein